MFTPSNTTTPATATAGSASSDAVRTILIDNQPCDGFEISPVHFADGICTPHLSEAEALEAQSEYGGVVEWGLYAHLVEGGVTHIADFPSEGAALRAYADRTGHQIERTGAGLHFLSL